MPDDAQDAIAGEYVLGTLSGDEREHAEALMAIDPGFADSVRRWERRLGELNVMVEAVEPPPEVWDKIKAAINPAPPQPAEVKPTADELSRSALLAPALEPKPEAKPEPSFEPQLEAQPEAKAEPVLPFEPTLPPASTLPPAPPPPLPAPVPEFDLDDGRIEPRLDLGLEPRSETLPETRPETTWPEGRAEPPSPADTLAASLLPSTDEDELPAGVSESITASLAEQLSVPPAEERARRAEPQVDRRLEPPIDNRIEQRMERSAEIIYLSRRVARWRRLTMAMAAVAALLALYVGVSRFVPGLGSSNGQQQVAARTTAPSRLPARLVGALQQDPNTPAFLLTVDPQSRTLVVRRVSATPERGRSYELWLIAGRAAPQSLGLIGGEEFTQRAIPGNFDLDTLRDASYAVSLEPAGGSPSGAPTGPVLFTGKLVESVPAAPPQTPRT